MFLFVRMLARTFKGRTDVPSKKGKGKLYLESAMPTAILDEIRLLKAQTGWIWKGEYNNLGGEPRILEILMYNQEGVLRIVHISDTGEMKYVYPKDGRLFCVCS